MADQHRGTLNPVFAATGILCVGLYISLAGQGPPAAVGAGTCANMGPPPVRSYHSYFGRQQPLEAESSEWRIRLSSWKPAKWPPAEFTFWVENKHNGKSSQFTLSNNVPPFYALQIDEIDLVEGDIALLLGREGANYSVADVVGLPRGDIRDHFSCFVPVVSPTHRFLAFIKSFPGHFVFMSDEYLIYDLTRDAPYNRLHPSPPATSGAGLPMYPPGATNAPGDNLVSSMDSPSHIDMSGGFSWVGPDDVAFVDLFEGESRLVSVSLSGGATAPIVRTVYLNPSELVGLQACQKVSNSLDFEKWSTNPALLLRVVQIAASSQHPGDLCLRFAPNSCLRNAELAVSPTHEGISR